MKTAISLPDAEFERFERLAARHGMNRSEFFRRAGRHFAATLEGEDDLTALANAAIANAGAQPIDLAFVAESQRIIIDGSDW